MMPIPKFNKPVEQLVGKTRIAWYNSVATAHGMTGIAPSSILDVIKGKLKAAGGYQWREEKTSGTLRKNK